MHELGIVVQVVDLASARANGARVHKLTLEIGKLSLVMPEAVRFCWDVAAKGTALEGCVLDIVLVDGRGRCRACSAEVLLERPLGRCTCGSTDLEWIGGMDVRIAKMEVD